MPWAGSGSYGEGIAFAVWARAYLGGNWSGAVTVKVGPSTGAQRPLSLGAPSYLFRHDSGDAGNCAGSRAGARVGGRRAAVLGFKIKSKIEEQAMLSTFGAEYDEYSRSTGSDSSALAFLAAHYCSGKIEASHGCNRARISRVILRGGRRLQSACNNKSARCTTKCGFWHSEVAAACAGGPPQFNAKVMCQQDCRDGDGMASS